MVKLNAPREEDQTHEFVPVHHLDMFERPEALDLACERAGTEDFVNPWMEPSLWLGLGLPAEMSDQIAVNVGDVRRLCKLAGIMHVNFVIADIEAPDGTVDVMRESMFPFLKSLDWAIARIKIGGIENIEDPQKVARVLQRRFRNKFLEAGCTHLLSFELIDLIVDSSIAAMAAVSGLFILKNPLQIPSFYLAAKTSFAMAVAERLATSEVAEKFPPNKFSVAGFGGVELDRLIMFIHGVLTTKFFDVIEED